MKNFLNVMMGSGSGFVDKPRLINTDLNIVFDGDSLTEGINNAGIDQYYPKVIRDYLQPKCKSLTFNSFGVSGQTTQAMLSDITTQILPLYDVGKSNMIIAWEDVNAILNSGRTAAENIADFESYFGQCKSTGFEYTILLLGYYPRKKVDGTYNQVSWNVGDPSPLDIQAQYFDNAVSSGLTNVDLIIDLRNDATIGGAREQQLVDTTIFADSVHLQSIGYDALANYVIENGILNYFRL